MNKHIGSSLESLLEERGIKEEVDLLTRKKILAEEFHRSMVAKHLTLSALASRMETSRTVVYRLLDPKDTSVTLATIVRASTALGMDLVLHVVDTPVAPPPKAAPRRAAKKAVRAQRAERAPRKVAAAGTRGHAGSSR
jgi:antitoxin HicB